MTSLFQTPRSTRNGGALSENLRTGAMTVGVLAALMVVLQVVNSVTNYWLTSQLGITPRNGDGLLGVLFAPLLHGSWAHLWSNLVLVLILGFLVTVGGSRQFVAVTAVVWIVSGLGVWLTAAPGTVTIGASVLVFGWLAYLVLRGFLTRSWWQIAIGLVRLALWGSVFWTGIAVAAFSPGPVSWQGHLFGAIGGGLAAVLVARADKGVR